MDESRQEKEAMQEAHAAEKELQSSQYHDLDLKLRRFQNLANDQHQQLTIAKVI